MEIVIHSVVYLYSKGISVWTRQKKTFWAKSREEILKSPAEGQIWKTVSKPTMDGVYATS